MNTTKSPIWHCNLTADELFEKLCPLQWESLDCTSDPQVRNCGVCNKDVFLCTTPEEFIEHAKRRDCVAIPSELDIEGKPCHCIGNPSPSSYELEDHARQWWDQVCSVADPQLNLQIKRDMRDRRTRQYMCDRSKEG